MMDNFKLSDIVTSAFEKSGLVADAQHYFDVSVANKYNVYACKLNHECSCITELINNYSSIGLTGYMHTFGVDFPRILINPVCDYLRSKGFIVVGGVYDNRNVVEICKVYIQWIGVKNYED